MSSLARALGVLACLLSAACSGESDGARESANTAAPESSSAWFVDATAESGVDFVHDAGLTPEKHLPETMGAGGALFDMDGDGDLDLYLLQGGPMPGAGPEPGTFVAPAGALPTNRLYSNDGRGHFTDVTAHSGAAAHSGYAMGVAVGDLNGDGHLDLLVTNLGPDVLLLGDGRGSFRDATRESGIDDARWTTAAACFDAEGDGDLDLYVTGYVLVDFAHPIWCGERKPGWRSACHPDAYAPLQDRLWLNRGDGTFVDATQSHGVADSWGKGLGVQVCDPDDDGDLDLYVANDSTENRMWLNDGHGHFEDATLLSGTGVDGRGLTEAGMGQASGDIDGDLDIDLFVTNFDDESNTLYLNHGGALFEDRTLQAGLEAPSRMPVGFGTVLEDFDLDGDLDLAVTNGHIIDNIQLYHDGKTHAQRSQLFENDGAGRLRELRDGAGALGATPFVGRGLYAGDLDGDGDHDLVLTVCGGSARIFRNVRGAGRSFTLRGLPERTRVELVGSKGRRIAREVGPQPSYFGSCGPDVLASLGGEELVEVLVRVPYSEPVSVRLDAPLSAGVCSFTRVGATWNVQTTPRR